MTSVKSSIQSVCQEYLNALNIDELNLKNLKKITTILKTDEKYQREIFINLTEKGLNKLMSGMKDNNQEIRKLSVRVLVEILNNNEVLQNIFCEKFQFNPIGNIICMNWMPKYLKDNIPINENVINEIKNSYYPNRCKYWMWPYNSKYNEQSYPDPMKYLVGFYYANKNNNLNNVVIEDKYKINLNHLTNQLEANALGGIAAGSGSESATKIEQTILKNERKASVMNDYNDKPMMTEPVQNNLKTKDISSRAKSPFINSGSGTGSGSGAGVKATNILNKGAVVHSPEMDSIQQLKNMINNPATIKPKANAVATNAVINTQQSSGLKDEYKKIKKVGGYSKSIDVNIPLNTLSNVTTSTKKTETSKLVNKTPFGKYSGIK